MVTRNIGVRFCLIALFLFCYSCKKKETVVQPVYPISAYVGNYQWYVNSVSATLALDTSNNQRIVDITATDGTKTITMEFLDHASGDGVVTATHSVPTDAYFLYSPGVGTSDSTNSGTVTITANNPSTHTLSATFDFVVRAYNGGAWTHVSNGALNNIGYSIVYR